MSRRSSSTHGSTSGSSRRRRRRCSTSFLATWGDPCRPEIAGVGRGSADRRPTGSGNQKPIEREIAGQSDAWFMRRILPYRTRDKKIEGVVITFVDITERRSTAQALTPPNAKRNGEHRQVALSRGGEPRSSPPLQTLVAAAGAACEQSDGRERAEIGRPYGGGARRHDQHVEYAARHQPDRGRRVKVETADFPVTDCSTASETN